MYQSFSITAIEVNNFNETIVVTTGFDIDPNTVNGDTVRLFSKADKTDVVLDFEVKDKVFTIYPKNKIVQNSEYVLRITGVKNILGMDLNSGVRRTISFTSAIKEVPSIISPADYEELVDLKVALKAIIEDKESDDMNNKSFFIQIASDVAFINIILETFTDKSVTDLKNLPMGQYYIRARVESTDRKEKGKWSDIITFISINNNTIDTPDDDAPIIIEDIDLVSLPVNGETPESILLEFSGEIDQDSIDNIIVIRRDI